jgi:hypothetical protein
MIEGQYKEVVVGCRVGMRRSELPSQMMVCLRRMGLGRCFHRMIQVSRCTALDEGPSCQAFL